MKSEKCITLPSWVALVVIIVSVVVLRLCLQNQPIGILQAAVTLGLTTVLFGYLVILAHNWQFIECNCAQP